MALYVVLRALHFNFYPSDMGICVKLLVVRVKTEVLEDVETGSDGKEFQPVGRLVSEALRVGEGVEEGLDVNANTSRIIFVATVSEDFHVVGFDPLVTVGMVSITGDSNLGRRTGG